MNYKKIPYVKKEISPIVFGTATPALFDAIDTSRADLEECRQKAFELMDDVFAAGINCFDCSNHYGEEILGEWIELRGIRKKLLYFPNVLTQISGETGLLISIFFTIYIMPSKN